MRRFEGIAAVLTFAAFAHAAVVTSPNYYAAGNADPGGMPFNFVDISASGTSIFSNEDDSNCEGPPCSPAVINLLQPFVFYEYTFNQFLVNSNGYMMFIDPPARPISDPNDFANEAFPNGVFSWGAVMPFWDDLITDAWWQYFPGGAGGFTGPTTVIMWSGGFFGRTGTVEFEVLLDHLKNRILFQYRQVTGNGDSATVGVSDRVIGSGLPPRDFVQYSFDSAGAIPDSSTVLFSPTPEPGTLGLLSVALAGICAMRRRSRH